MATAISSNSKKEWVLKRETEIRCEVPESGLLTIKLVSGSAEVFGVEMAPNKEYLFHDQNIAIFTWYGCTVESSGADSTLYVADSTPMVSYVNTHVQLEAKRDVALANAENGPRVMIVGPTDHGKSTISQILAAYAVRLDRNPLFVDLDVGQGALSIPGCLSAISLDKSSLSIEDGFVNQNPLVYFYGQSSPRENVDLYKLMITNLAAKVNSRFDRDCDAKASGLIANTCGWVDGAGFDVLLHCIQAFSIDVVLVMSHDKLFSTLVSALDANAATKNSVTVVKLPRSGGVVNRDTTVRRRLRKCKIREYFYGRPQSPQSITFSPERREGLQLSSFVFLRVGGGTQLTQGMRIVGDSSHQDACKLTKISPTGDLVNSVLAVLHFPVTQDALDSKGDGNLQAWLSSNVAGFLSIVQLDTDSDRMTVLSPSPGALPSNYLLVGFIKWVE